jgi:hypothetical protein
LLHVSIAQLLKLLELIANIAIALKLPLKPVVNTALALKQLALPVFLVNIALPVLRLRILQLQILKITQAKHSMLLQ